MPTKTPQERAQDELKLRISFPVSSGQQHRATEGVITVCFTAFCSHFIILLCSFLSLSRTRSLFDFVFTGFALAVVGIFKRPFVLLVLLDRLPIFLYQ